jgi:isoleucyl-tRNA synthetase
VLHDGPPFASGPAHLGHLYNKVLKDVINRYKLLRGYRVHFLPGFDCYGTNIEDLALKGKADLVEKMDLNIVQKKKVK